MHAHISVIIATAWARTDWLINRSLRSIYNQKNIDATNVDIFIIDDNENSNEFAIIQKQVGQLRKNLQINTNNFITHILKNQRTRFMSGTGAWNTGIWQAYQRDSQGFVAILDDDDEYYDYHLADCVGCIKIDTDAIFQRLIWEHSDGNIMPLPLTKNDLTPENFFIGNPGVQGSNMFFKTKHLVDINGFDETLPNTTDRDLMIRFLWHMQSFPKSTIHVLENIGVKHYNHQQIKVNTNLSMKHQGLDIFYRKYKPYFSASAYQKSLARAKKLFNYIPIHNE